MLAAQRSHVATAATHLGLPPGGRCAYLLAGSCRGNQCWKDSRITSFTTDDHTRSHTGRQARHLGVNGDVATCYSRDPEWTLECDMPPARSSYGQSAHEEGHVMRLRLHLPATVLSAAIAIAIATGIGDAQARAEGPVQPALGPVDTYSPTSCRSRDRHCRRSGIISKGCSSLSKRQAREQQLARSRPLRNSMSTNLRRYPQYLNSYQPVARILVSRNEM
jgi:hypothetical protein